LKLHFEQCHIPITILRNCNEEHFGQRLFCFSAL
jgi:hypothetical protein